MIACFKVADNFLLTGSLNRKFIVKVRTFSSAKAIDMENDITRTKRAFHPGLHVLHVGTNDLTLDDTPKKVTEHTVNIATFLKIENNTVLISNIIPRGNNKKEKQKQLANHWLTSANRKKYLSYIMAILA